MGNEKFSFTENADRTRIVEMLGNIPIERWGKVGDDERAYTCVALPFGFHVSWIERASKSESFKQYVLRVYFLEDVEKPRDAVRHEGEEGGDICGLYQVLKVRDNEIVRYESLRELVEATCLE